MNPFPVPEDAKRARPWCESLTIGPPVDSTPHDNIGTLPALVEAVDGQPIRVFSYWKPTPSELEILNGGGSIELSVMSWPMVPVSVAVFPSRQLVGWLARQPAQPTNEVEQEASDGHS